MSQTREPEKKNDEKPTPIGAKSKSGGVSEYFINSVTSAPFIAVGTFPLALLKRKAQMSLEAKSVSGSPSSKPIQIQLPAERHGAKNLMYNLAKALAASTNVAIQKTLVRDGVKDVLHPGGGHADEGKQASVLSGVILPAITASAIDTVLMNYSLNMSFLRNNILLNPEFKIPEKLSLHYKYNIAKASFVPRLLKTGPSVAGLIGQPYVNALLPSDLGGGLKHFLTGVITGSMVSPIIASLDGVNARQLASVNYQGRTLSMPSLLKLHGPRMFVPSAGTLTATLITQVGQQLIIPQADRLARAYVTPHVMEAVGSLSHAAARSIEHYPESAEPDPGFGDCGGAIAFGFSMEEKQNESVAKSYDSDDEIPFGEMFIPRDFSIAEPSKEKPDAKKSEEKPAGVYDPYSGLIDSSPEKPKSGDQSIGYLAWIGSSLFGSSHHSSVAAEEIHEDGRPSSIKQGESDDRDHDSHDSSGDSSSVLLSSPAPSPTATPSPAPSPSATPSSEKVSSGPASSGAGFFKSSEKEEGSDKTPKVQADDDSSRYDRRLLSSQFE